MSDALGWVCFSNAPFRWVKRVFFHRWALWSVGGALAVGLPLALIGVAVDRMGLVAAGVVLTVPFLLWVALLAGVSLLLAVPRLVVLGLVLATAYFRLTGLSRRLAEWGARYEETPRAPQ